MSKDDEDGSVSTTSVTETPDYGSPAREHSQSMADAEIRFCSPDYIAGWDDAIEAAAKVADNPANVRMVGGSTGDALGTAHRIAAEIRGLLRSGQKESE